MRFFETGEIYYCSAPVDWRMRMSVEYCEEDLTILC